MLTADSGGYMNHTISLNGTWSFDLLSDAPYTDTAEPRIAVRSDSALEIPVPGYWEDMADRFRSTALHTKLRCNPLYTLQRYPQAGYVPDMALPNPVGCFVYTKTVTLSPDLLAGNFDAESGTVTLCFGGAQNTVSAWVNGNYLGRHEGYSAPFSFAVPREHLVPGENRITLAVSNFRLSGYMSRPISGLTSRAANECTGGIFGDVELCFAPDGLSDVWVTTSPDCKTFTVHTAGADMAEKTVSVYDGDVCVKTVTLAAGETAAIFDATGLSLWSPDAPKLYSATVTTAHQTLSRRFGIRRLTVCGTRLYLNGEPYFFRGTCEHCYQPQTVHPTRDKTYYRHVLRTLKDLGFNSVRFHTWVPPVEYFCAADELGMVLEIESPNNTTLAEWAEIVRFCRPHPSVNLYSTGNELQIDDDYVRHLHACAELVHTETDSLFSPMSAMRGIEYNFVGDETVDEPFRHNPARLYEVGQFCDVYNSYSNALTSYSSAQGTQPVLDKRNAVYGKPLLSHEICIHGTYIDLSLEERYRGTRIGDTEFMSSVRKHLSEVGLYDRAPLYYRNSAAWQRLLRKHCFETVRRCETFAGYDFLGDIDTHWHTFGYCVGMMNEFYEMKPGETRENVLRYNSDTVLLADFISGVNFSAGAEAEIPILVSHYGKPIPSSRLSVRIRNENSKTVLYRREISIEEELPRGEITELTRVTFRIPACDKPAKLSLVAVLSGGDTDCENMWELYGFPENGFPENGSPETAIPACAPACAPTIAPDSLLIVDDIDGASLLSAMQAGKTVVLFGTGPFAARDVSYQLSVAGRTNGHLATVIADHPLMEAFPHDGYCAAQFASLLEHSHAAVLDLPGNPIPHRPIIDVASSYKNAHREALLFEYGVGKTGRLLVCTLNLCASDPAARWLKRHITEYAKSASFAPEQALTYAQLAALFAVAPVTETDNENLALNRNDITV